MKFECCPLCKHAPMKIWESSDGYTCHGCINCEVSGMSRFMANYLQEELVSTIWWLKDYYIRIDYKGNRTSVSRITHCFLLDTVIIEGFVFDVNTDDPVQSADRLDILMLFS